MLNSEGSCGFGRASELIGKARMKGMLSVLYKCLFAAATVGLAAAQDCIQVVGQPSLPCIGLISGGSDLAK